jgi:ABC-type branched-subunit amino acid transport system substrate-binding protein
MAIFDQRGQQVNYQYNAAGDINLGSVQNQAQLIEELSKLKSELSKAAEAQVIDAEIFTDADYQMTKAIQQAKKSEPDTKGIMDHLNNTKSLLEGVTAASGIVAALNNVVQLVVGLF